MPMRQHAGVLVGDVMLLIALIIIGLAAAGVALSFKNSVSPTEALLARDLQSLVSSIVMINQSGSLTMTTIPMDSLKSRLGLVLYINMTSNTLILYDEYNRIDVDVLRSLLDPYVSDLQRSGFNVTVKSYCGDYSLVRPELAGVVECYLAVFLGGVDLTAAPHGGSDFALVYGSKPIIVLERQVGEPGVIIVSVRGG